jgi:hypothetical protein
MIKTFLAAVVLTGCLSAHPPTPNAPRESRHVYRVDFSVAANDPGKPPTTSSYTLNLEEHDNGEVHMGTNVALSSQTRVDVGLKITATLFQEGDDVVLRDNVEMSGLDDTSSATLTAIHKVTTRGDAVLKLGHPALVASLEDPTTHKHYEVTAAATLLR